MEESKVQQDPHCTTETMGIATDASDRGDPPCMCLCHMMQLMAIL